MSSFKKAASKIKEGVLKEILSELVWIYRYGFRYKWSILLYIAFGVFGVIMGCSGSIMSKIIIDTVTGFDSARIAPVAVFFVLMQFFRIVCNAVTSRISAKVSLRVDQEIRADVYDKIMDADWESMSSYHSGDILNRVDNDVAAVSGSVLGWIPNFITGIAQFAGTLGVILYYDRVLALISLLSAPVTLIVSRITMRKLREYVKKTREASSDVMIFNEESFSNLQVIKSFGITNLYGQKLRKVQDKFKKVKLEQNKLSIATSTVMSATGVIVATVCFAWGVYRLWTGDITYGTMTLFLQMSASLSGSFSLLVNMIPSAISAATAAGRIMAITELPGESREDDEKVNRFVDENGKKGISVCAEKINFAYCDGKPVLSNVNFYARPGEIIAIVGSSGVGKTTFLRLLLGIVSPKDGEVFVYGEKTDEKIKVSASTRRIFSYVPQGNTMFEGTVADNLKLLNPYASVEEINSALKIACAYNFISELPDGIDSPMKENGGGFSEGQIQRLSIARALLADSSIILLDEATSALDTETERLLLNNIVKSDKKRTCIVVTHCPGVIGACDRVYRISEGTFYQADKDEVVRLMTEL
ncbi:MAG: ABC transporter ATP-binding protein [Clostridia bacterium]|nr:ABC transporter ATP-binding protein [Clostridia bacterium]